MNRIPIIELQLAVVDRIGTDSPLLGAVTFAHIPGINTDPPWIHLGPYSCVPSEYETKNRDSVRVTMDLEIVTQAVGYTDCATIVDRVVKSLTRDTLTLSNGFAHFMTTIDACEMSERDFDEIGLFQVGTLRMSFYIEDISQDYR